jgi:hypothetical protein
LSSPAAILCTKCGAASDTAASACAKCGGRNARVCGACGFQNSVAKNYCDKCGTSISELGGAVAPPPSTGTPSDIPQTEIRRTSAASEPGLPQARGFAAQPGAPQGAPLPQSAPAPYVSADPWGTPEPLTLTAEAPKPKFQKVRVLVNVLAAAVGMLICACALWYWHASRKPERLVPRLAARYLDALRARDFETAYELFSDAARKNVTLDEFKASRAGEEWAWSKLEIEHQEPGAMLLKYELSVNGASPRPDHLLFVKEGERWVRPYNGTLMRKVEEAFEKGSTDNGQLLAQVAAAIDPRDPMARGYLCEAAYYRKAPQETVSQCMDALKLSQTYPSNLSLKSLYHLHAILADTYKNALRQPSLALDQYAQMLSFPDISPADQCEILLARSEAYAGMGRPGESAADLDRAEQLCAKRADFDFIRRMRDALKVPERER